MGIGQWAVGSSRPEWVAVKVVGQAGGKGCGWNCKVAGHACLDSQPCQPSNPGAARHAGRCNMIPHLLASTSKSLHRAAGARCRSLWQRASCPCPQAWARSSAFSAAPAPPKPAPHLVHVQRNTRAVEEGLDEFDAVRPLRVQGQRGAAHICVALRCRRVGGGGRSSVSAHRLQHHAPWEPMAGRSALPCA